MGLIGERFGATAAASRYIKHHASGHLRDGEPVDAGSLYVLENNLAHLSFESVRHLVWDPGPGLPGKASDPAGYGGLEDVGLPPGTLAGFQEVAWDADTSRHFGPFCARSA